MTFIVGFFKIWDLTVAAGRRLCQERRSKILTIWTISDILATPCPIGWLEIDLCKTTSIFVTCCLFNPIQGTLCPLRQNRSISSKRLGVWSYCFVTFLSMYFPFRKVQFHQSALMYVAMATIQLFGLILITRISISIVFQVFQPERNFLWDNLLCFGHHNTLRSLIKANIRTFTMETFQKIILPKYGHKH